MSDNNIWNSHGRPIGIAKLRSILKLKIDDLSDKPELYKVARSYNDILCDYADKQFNGTFLHSRMFI